MINKTDRAMGALIVLGKGAPQRFEGLADDRDWRLEGVSIFFGGFDKAGPPTKGHLTSFANVLTSSKEDLLEYCVMVWGLLPAEQSDLVKQMKEKYQMTEYIK